MKKAAFILILLITLPIFGQQVITLQECYNLVLKNYPLVKQTQLLKQQNLLEAKVISNSKLPQLNVEATATYFSEVTEFPLPNSPVEPLSKDQYRATLLINQLIYDGGETDASLDVKSIQLKTKQKQVDVTLYQLKKQVNQLYFSILLSQEKYLLLTSKQSQLQAKLKEVQSGIKNGILLASSDKILQVELLKINQQFIDVESTKLTLIQTLSSLIGQSLEISTAFQSPLTEIQFNAKISRPELELFQYKKEEIESTQTLISKQNTPKLHGFVTGGYGNPGLNFLDNGFQTFYTVGVKLNWKVFDWNTTKKRHESLGINKDIIDTETEIFRLNTNIELDQQQKEIDKIKAFINSDIEIIKLRKDVIKIADSQLKNGVITSSAYITELTNLYDDENTLVRHEIQLQLAKSNYNIIKGQ
jgi:outer membrane protein TolC